MRRRRFLASVLAGTTATATTGCLEDARESVLGVSAPSYAEWIPATLSDQTTEFTYYDVSDITDQENVTVEDFSGLPKYSDLDSLGTGDMETALSLRAEREIGSVVTGRFDKEGIAEELEERGFTEGEDEGVYRIFENDREEMYFAVSQGGIVESRLSTEGLIETVDAKNGDAERLVEASEDFKTLVNELGEGTVVSGRLTGESEGTFGENASGERFVIDGEVTDVLLVFLFESAVDADLSEEEVNSTIEEQGLRNTQIKTNLSVVKVTGQVDTENF